MADFVAKVGGKPRFPYSRKGFGVPISNSSGIVAEAIIENGSIVRDYRLLVAVEGRVHLRHDIGEINLHAFHGSNLLLGR